MVSERVSADEPPPLPRECALCGEDELLTWVDVRGPLGKVRRLAVCAACYFDLRASDAEAIDGDADE
jgi:hypothetical protein